MQKCIYCLTVFAKAPKEHIVNAFLGAKWKDGTLICSQCQSKYSNGIDKSLAERLQPFRLLLGIKGDHGGTGSPLKNLPVSSGETVDLGPHGQPILVRPVVSDDGHKQIKVNVRREKDLGWALSEVSKKHPHLNLDIEKIKKLGIKVNDRLEGKVSFDLTLDGDDFFRGVLKCCTNLFAVSSPAGRSEFLNPTFNAVREFVHNGTGQRGDFVRWLTTDEVLILPKVGDADHTITLTSRERNIEGVIVFFGQLPFSVRLATNYVGPPISCSYTVDPHHEAVPSHKKLLDEELSQFKENIPVFAEQSPTHCNDLVKEAWNIRLNRFFAYYVERENEEIVRKVVEGCIQENSKAAEMPREELTRYVREVMQQRFKQFEQTGDANGITVWEIRTYGGSSAAETSEA